MIGDTPILANNGTPVEDEFDEPAASDQGREAEVGADADAG